jgi:HK97 family phage portal protein
MIETLGSLSRAAGHDVFAIAPSSQHRDGNIADARVGSSVYNLLSQGAGTYTGRPVSPSTAMQYSPVYGIVSKIAKSVASCPLITHRNTGRNSDTKEPAITDYRYRLLKEQPNSEMSAFQWREAIVTHLLLWGNHFSFIEYDGAGRILNIWPLEPGYVQVMRTRVGGDLVYRYFPHNPYSVPVQPGVYSTQNILHIPYLGFDGIMGMSPITLMRQAIGLGLGAEEYMGRFYKNGGKPPYWIEYPGQIDDPDKFRETFRGVQSNLEDAGKAALMYGGMQLHDMKMSPADAQFVEGRNFQVSELCRIFDMPPGMMGNPGGKDNSFASAEQANIYYATHTISPVCERIEQKVNITILDSNDALTCTHDLRRLRRGDMKAIADTHSVEIMCGKIQPNEAREESNMNPVGNADDPANPMNGNYMQMQMVKVGTVPAPGTNPQPAKT